MKTEFSQGPFKLDEEAEGVIGCRDILDANGNGVASTHGLADDKEDLANARLLAAAPELLEALRLALGQLDHLQVTHTERWSNDLTNMVSAARVGGRKAIVKAVEG